MYTHIKCVYYMHAFINIRFTVMINVDALTKNKKKIKKITHYYTRHLRYYNNYSIIPFSYFIIIAQIYIHISFYINLISYNFFFRFILYFLVEIELEKFQLHLIKMTSLQHHSHHVNHHNTPSSSSNSTNIVSNTVS